MSSTTNVPDSISTITSPMSAIFTPPPSCSSHWTYEDASANSLVGGLMMQEAQWDRPDTPCFPSGFGGWGRAPSFIQVFSPGACPAGYTTANNNFNGEVTTGVCCPSNFVYTTYISGVNGASTTAAYFGCTSMFSGAGKTTVFAEHGGFSSTLDGTATMVTTVSGQITMWAQPITVAFQEADLSLFTTSTSSTTLSTATPSTITSSTITSSTTISSATTSSATTSLATTSSGTTSPTATSPSAIALTTSQGTTPSSSSPSPTSSTAAQTPSPSISLGAIAGIVIGAAAVLAIIIGAAIYFRKKGKTTSSAGRDHQTDYWQHDGSTDKGRPYHPNHEPYYHFQSEVKPGELDGRQRHQIAELPYHGDRRYELSS